MDKRIAKPGKNIGNKNRHSVPTTLWRAKTFLEDEYLCDIVATCDQQCFKLRQSAVTATEITTHHTS